MGKKVLKNGRWRRPTKELPERDDLIGVVIDVAEDVATIRIAPYVLPEPEPVYYWSSTGANTNDVSVTWPTTGTIITQDGPIVTPSGTYTPDWKVVANSYYSVSTDCSMKEQISCQNDSGSQNPESALWVGTPVFFSENRFGSVFSP